MTNLPGERWPRLVGMTGPQDTAQRVLPARSQPVRMSLAAAVA